MIESSFKTEQKNTATALHQGCQHLTCFNVIARTFGEPDRSCAHHEQDAKAHNLRTDILGGATSGEVAGNPWCWEGVSKGDTGHQEGKAGFIIASSVGRLRLATGYWTPGSYPKRASKIKFVDDSCGYARTIIGEAKKCPTMHWQVAEEQSRAKSGCRGSVSCGRIVRNKGHHSVTCHGLA